MNKTTETPALSDLTTKWQIYHEESAYYAPRAEKKMFEELRGQGDSRIYVRGKDEQGELLIAVSTNNPRRQNIIMRTVPGSRRDSGSALLFPATLLDEVATAIRAKKKRMLSEKRRKALTEQLAQIRENRKALAGSSIQPPKTDDLSQDDH